MTNGNRILVLLGTDADGKAHAARFSSSDEVAVRKAAALMGWRIGIAKEKTLTLASKLPEGKIFESGKSLVPLARDESFYALGCLTFDQAWAAMGVITGTDTAPDASVAKTGDAMWATIKVGSTVLVWEADPEAPAWFAAIVTAVSKNGETLTARWRDYPGCKPITVERRAVGLLKPWLGS